MFEKVKGWYSRNSLEIMIILALIGICILLAIIFFGFAKLEPYFESLLYWEHKKDQRTLPLGNISLIFHPVLRSLSKNPPCNIQ